jgi:hypothetical protein
VLPFFWEFFVRTSSLDFLEEFFCIEENNFIVRKKPTLKKSIDTITSAEMIKTMLTFLLARN